MIRIKKQKIKERLKSYFDRWNVITCLDNMEKNYNKNFNRAVDLKHVQILNVQECTNKGFNIYGDESSDKFSLFIEQLNDF